MPRFRRRLRMSGKPIHPTTWCAAPAGGINYTVSVDGQTNTTGLCSIATLVEFTNPTIVRIRGNLVVGNSQDGTEDQNSGWAVWLAIGLVDEEVGTVTALNTQAGWESDWMWRYFTAVGHTRTLHVPWNSSGVIQSAQAVLRASAGVATHERILVDVQAMRRVRGRTKLVLATTGVQRSGNSDFVVEGQLTALIKE